jgi:hypothetical protein
MNKAEKKDIKKAREEMDENPVSNAAFKIQSILEEVFQKGIEVGESIGYAKAAFEHTDLAKVDAEQEKKTRKGCKK